MFIQKPTKILNRLCTDHTQIIYRKNLRSLIGEKYLDPSDISLIFTAELQIESTFKMLCLLFRIFFVNIELVCKYRKHLSTNFFTYFRQVVVFLDFDIHHLVVGVDYHIFFGRSPTHFFYWNRRQVDLWWVFRNCKCFSDQAIVKWYLVFIVDIAKLSHGFC